MIWLIIIGFICVLIISGLAVVATILYSKQEQIPHDPVFIKSFFPTRFTGGFSQGYQTFKEEGTNYTIIEFIPTDVDFYKTQAIKPIKLVVDNRLIVTFPKGITNNGMPEMWLLPPKEEHINKEIKSTDAGKIMMGIIGKNQELKEEIDMIRGRMDTQSKILENTRGLKLTAEYMELHDKLINSIISKKKEGNKPSMGLPSGSE